MKHTLLQRRTPTRRPELSTVKLPTGVTYSPLPSRRKLFASDNNNNMTSTTVPSSLPLKAALSPAKLDVSAIQTSCESLIEEVEEGALASGSKDITDCLQRMLLMQLQLIQEQQHIIEKLTQDLEDTRRDRDQKIARLERQEALKEKLSSRNIITPSFSRQQQQPKIVKVEPKSKGKAPTHQSQSTSDSIITVPLEQNIPLEQSTAPCPEAPSPICATPPIEYMEVDKPYGLLVAPALPVEHILIPSWKCGADNEVKEPIITTGRHTRYHSPPVIPEGEEEDITDEAFELRHKRFETLERRRRKTEREQLLLQLHHQTNTAFNPANSLTSPRVYKRVKRPFSFWPDPYTNLLVIEVTDHLPLVAFGCPVPYKEPRLFKLPRRGPYSFQEELSFVGYRSGDYHGDGTKRTLRSSGPTTTGGEGEEVQGDGEGVAGEEGKDTTIVSTVDLDQSITSQDVEKGKGERMEKELAMDVKEDASMIAEEGRESGRDGSNDHEEKGVPPVSMKEPVEANDYNPPTEEQYNDLRRQSLLSIATNRITHLEPTHESLRSEIKTNHNRVVDSPVDPSTTFKPIITAQKEEMIPKTSVQFIDSDRTIIKQELSSITENFTMATEDSLLPLADRDIVFHPAIEDKDRVGGDNVANKNQDTVPNKSQESLDIQYEDPDDIPIKDTIYLPNKDTTEIGSSIVPLYLPSFPTLNPSSYTDTNHSLRSGGRGDHHSSSQESIGERVARRPITLRRLSSRTGSIGGEREGGESISELGKKGSPNNILSNLRRRLPRGRTRRR